MTVSTLNILFVHQSAELYGSDRTFVQSIRACRMKYPHALITVLLPFEGPLIDYIQPVANQVIIDDDLIILRKSTFVRTIILKPVNFIRQILKSIKLIKCHDLTYINTTVILCFIIATRFSKKTSIIHIHELPTGLLKIILNLILCFSNGKILFNSRATCLAYPVVKYRNHAIIPNGTNIEHYKPIKETATLNVLLIGRFNAWKGHTLLLNALSLLTKEKQALIQIRFLGSTFKGQQFFKDSIQETTVRLGLSSMVSFYDFVDDPSSFYYWANLIVVPSILPEPFGLVAIESMGHGRPVIGSNHGGLADIIEHNSAGYLFAPGNAKELAERLLCYINDPEKLLMHGKQARSVFLKRFHENSYLESIGQVFQNNYVGNKTENILE